MSGLGDWGGLIFWEGTGLLVSLFCFREKSAGFFAPSEGKGQLQKAAEKLG